MDTGSKFLFTTLGRDDFGGLPKEMRDKLWNTGFGRSEHYIGGDLFGIVSRDDIGLSIDDMEISRAVAAPASVPMVLGPIILKDRRARRLSIRISFTSTTAVSTTTTA